jgi:hypothetical protein
VHWPYSLDFAEAFFAAQSCAGLMLTALVLYWQFGSRLARGVMLLAVWLAVVAYSLPGFATSIGYKPGPDALREILAVSGALGMLAAVLALRPVVSVLALLGEIPLWLVDGFVKESDAEICALHLAWLGLLVGLLVRGSARAPRTTGGELAGAGAGERSYLLHDVVVFALSTLLAALVCVLLLRKHDGSADEWGYTYQAAVFAKGRLYADSPRCQPYLQSFYVFETSGRLFSQYTPGWPLLLAPFVALRVIWLSGPVAMGFMVVGIARVARSLARGFGRHDAPPSTRVVAAAGTAAAVLTMLGTSTLTHGGSRFSHVPEVALYVWSLEALFVVSTPGLDRTRQFVWGIVLGCAAAFMLATRPADGAFLGLGLAFVFLYVLARRRVGWRALATATAGFAFWSALTLVILRVQLGKWFTTGYSLNAVIHPWNVVKYSMPHPNEWKYGLPLATGSYCWWPASMALGLAGLATARGRSLSLVWAIAVGCVAYVTYCSFLDLGQRGFDWGYGPRYLMPLLVPMGAGGGVALAPLVVAARERSTAGRSALARGGPMALAAFAIASGWVRIVPLHWPTVEQHTRRHAGLNTAIDKMHLQNAVVIAQPGTTGFDSLDLTTNLPIDLYPQQDVIIAIEKTPDAASCLRAAFPGRHFYRASGVDDVHITPF